MPEPCLPERSEGSRSNQDVSRRSARQIDRAALNAEKYPRSFSYAQMLDVTRPPDPRAPRRNAVFLSEAKDLARSRCFALLSKTDRARAHRTRTSPEHPNPVERAAFTHAEKYPRSFSYAQLLDLTLPPRPRALCRNPVFLSEAKDLARSKMLRLAQRDRSTAHIEHAQPRSEVRASAGIRRS